MSRQFRQYDRDTQFLIPPSLDEWLPEDHLARFVAEVVDRVDLSPITRAYGGGGKDAYHPSVLVCLLFYGYATGTFSSRKLERATYDSVAVRWLTCNTHPDHDTISHFRRRFLKELEALFVRVLVLAREMGLLRVGKVSLDGTKIKANASKHKAMSWGYLQRLEKQLRGEVERLMAAAESADREAPDLDVPEELRRREERLAKLAEVHAEIERRSEERLAAEKAAWAEKVDRRAEREKELGRKLGGSPPKEPEGGPKDKDQVNFTDGDSRIMASSDGFVQGYNAQAAVDVDTHLVVSHHVSDCSNDKKELAPALEALSTVEEEVGRPDALLADSGYFSKANPELCEERGITPYIAMGRVRHNVPLEERSAKAPGCAYPQDAVGRMVHRLATREGKAVYAKRKATVETVFGVIKAVLGFRQFHLRGREAARAEWSLVCLAWNLKRMHALAA